MCGMCVLCLGVVVCCAVSLCVVLVLVLVRNVWCVVCVLCVRGVLVVGCWLLVVGCWLLVVGCWLLVVGCWLLVVGCWCCCCCSDDSMSVCISTSPQSCNPTTAKLIEKACKPGDVGLHDPWEITQPQLCHVHEQSPKLHDHNAS